MESIVGILQEIRPEFEFEGSNDFFAEGLLDSMDLVTLVTTLDERYSIAIDGVDIVPENFENVAAIRRLLAKHGIDE